MATTEKREITTVQVTRSVHSRLEALKPYESMSYNEFIEELVDTYEDC